MEKDKGANILLYEVGSKGKPAKVYGKEGQGPSTVVDGSPNTSTTLVQSPANPTSN